MKEIFGDNPKNFIYFGNSADMMRTWLTLYANKVDMIYLDPPAPSGISFKLIQKVGINQGRITHFEKVPKNSDYNSFIIHIIKLCSALLNKKGNIFVHCTPKTSNFFRNILDKVFGQSNFVNEIIYENGEGTNSSRHFSYTHETILFYRVSSSSWFNPEPTAQKRGEKRHNHMRKNTSSDGRVYYSITMAGKEYRYYEDDLIHMGDVWRDIENDKPNDRYKYEGQKSQALLRRMISSACPDGGIVCDPFCGTGVSALAAAEINRNFLVCDNSRFAINLTKTNAANQNISFCTVWDDINVYENMPKVKFSNKSSKIHLDDYRIKGGEEYYTNNLLPTEDTLVENWTVGRIIDDIYYIDDIDIRTQDKPSLGRYLQLKSEKGKPCAVTFDVFGNQVMHKMS